jgi:hypothetical protein
MQRPNVNDRGTVERIYPRAVFQQEANANMRGNASVLSGVRIVSAADESGAFDLVRASRHAGESDSSDGAIFLPPAAPGAAPGSPAPAWDDAYARFIDKIIATAARAEFAPSPGPGDARLRGLRQ